MGKQGRDSIDEPARDESAHHATQLSDLGEPEGRLRRARAKRPPPTLESQRPPAAKVIKRPAAKKMKHKRDLRQTFLYETAALYFKTLSKKQQNQLTATIRSRRWTIASACTGTGTAEIANQCLMKFMEGEQQVQFSCELKHCNQNFLQSIVEPLLDQDERVCLFQDIGELAQGVCKCLAHNKDCDVSKLTDIFTCGFSCKDLSPLSRKFKGTQWAGILSNQWGTTGQTFAGLVEHIRRAMPHIIVLENVSSLVKADSSNLEYLWMTFDEIGYAGAERLMKSSSFRLPQSRERVYFVLLNRNSFGYNSSEAVQKASSMLEDALKLATDMEPLGNFLLPANSARVLAERERRTAAARSVKVVPGKTGEKRSDSWVDTHQAT